MDNKLKQITIMEAMGRMKLNQAETDLPQTGESPVCSGYLHRDLKPSNFAIGFEPDFHKIYIIDFGLSRQFNRRQRASQHDKELSRSIAPFRETARYASLDAHRNVEQSRHDDFGGMAVHGILENPQINRLAHLRGHSRLRLRVEMLEMVEMEMLDLAKEDNGVMYIDPLDWDLTHCYTGPKYKITA
ncbi:unnamed protein product, partial [Mesorhabditis belari]|uniref:Protein kinase domain-containing protein n=1 Tax=Mesorhabditis belari TaxID=2138241 RepID=A0AAF3F1J9_9BILA